VSLGLFGFEDPTRIDNGTKYTNGDFLKFCEERGIKRHYTVWKTRKKNAMAERLNKTIIEIARCP
jgi:transposase InsO family protein